MGVRAMKGGAVDVLPKPVNKEELLEAVERAVAIARRDRRERARIKEVRDRIKTLTPREARVFALVVTGMLNKQSAAELGPRDGEDAGRIAGRAGSAGRRSGRARGQVRAFAKLVLRMVAVVIPPA